MNWEAAVSGFVAGVLTVFDLDRTFYFPSKIQKRFRLWAWYCFFVLANAGLAAGLYLAVRDLDTLKSLNVWLKATIVGASYLAIIRAKLTTFEVSGKSIPFGPEALYDAAKAFVYKRINHIAKAARRDETLELAGKKTLTELGQEAKLAIDQDALMTPDEKRAYKEWLLKVLQEGQAASDDADQRNAIADFILSGRRVL